MRAAAQIASRCIIFMSGVLRRSSAHPDPQAKAFRSDHITSIAAECPQASEQHRLSITERDEERLLVGFAPLVEAVNNDDTPPPALPCFAKGGLSRHAVRTRVDRAEAHFQVFGPVRD